MYGIGPESFHSEGDAACGALLVGLPDETGEGIGPHPGVRPVHVEEDGLALLGGEAEAADTAEYGHRTAAVSADAARGAAPGRADVMEEGAEDDALTGEVPRVGEAPAAGLEGVLRETADPAVVGVAAG